jgi:transposase
MKQEVFNAYNKYRILKHGQRTKNISETCQIFGISRTTYYQWKKAYESLGMKGLEIKEPQKPIMPNKVNPIVEREILYYVQSNPIDGPKRIYYELKSEDFEVGETGIFNVLKRNGLTTREKRMRFAKNASPSPLSSQKHKAIKVDLDNNYPGYLVLQRIDYMGKFEGVGKIYQYTAYDTSSKWVFVKIYNRKNDIDVWDFFEVKLVYLMRTFKLDISNLFTEKNKAFVSYFVKNDKYKELINRFKINHQFLTADQMPLFEEVDIFIRELTKSFYDKIGVLSHLDSFINVERALHRAIRHYNFKETIPQGQYRGRVPASIVLERAEANHLDMNTLPLWVMALINPLKKEEDDEKE